MIQVLSAELMILADTPPTTGFFSTCPKPGLQSAHSHLQLQIQQIASDITICEI
jgi:hypothetical protein